MFSNKKESFCLLWVCLSGLKGLDLKSPTKEQSRCVHLLQALAKTIHLTSPSFTDEVHYRKSGEIR